ncbi:MAG: hypothetical protein ABIU96_07465 [Rhodanobacter sp.]
MSVLGIQAICSAVLLTSVAVALPAQTAAQWRAQQLEASRQSEHIMREADKLKGLLARYQAMRYAYMANKDPAFRLIFGQYLSWYQSFIGNYPDAAASFAIKEVAQTDDHPSPLGAGGYTARPAVKAIAELAKNYQLVFLNEAHNVPLTRTLTVQLLPQLRAAGFNYFAVETLYQSDKALAARGYPTADSGFYTAEPISAEMVRAALKLGFHVIGYEALSNATGDAREAEQARNIYRDVFQRDPHARLVVEAGYAHIQQSGVFLGGKSMAQHLHRLSGIDGLAVEQTMMTPHPHDGDDHPLYTAIVQQLQPNEPIVFENAAGKPWTLRDGYTVSVIFPQQKLRRGRPTWLSLGGLRQPYVVNGDRCAGHFPCLIEARYASEGDDAIPADRMVLDPLPPLATLNDRVRQGQGAPIGELYLRPGKYRLTISDTSTHTLFRKDITINAPPVAAPAPAPTASARSTSPP